MKEIIPTSISGNSIEVIILGRAQRIRMNGIINIREFRIMIFVLIKSGHRIFLKAKAEIISETSR